MRGRRSDTQSLSTVFRLANVDVAGMASKQELWRLMREASEAGDYRLPRLEGSIHRTPQEGVVMCLMTRMAGVDATDPDQLTAAELEGRRQCHEYARFLRERVPGFARAALVSTSPAIGVRESRRIIGEHVLTADEVLAGASFDDQIARCGAPVEDHHAGSDTRWAYLSEGATYGIPYRSLLPRSVEGLRGRRALLQRLARRARLGPLDGDVHGDGPGGGDGGGARGRRRLGAAGARRAALRRAAGRRRRGRGAVMVDVAGALAAARVVAVLRAAREPAEVIEAVVAGGIRVVEITLDSPDAEAVIAAARERHPDVLVGAGTVRTAVDVDRAVDAGAAFCVAPATVPEALSRAARAACRWSRAR